MRWSVLLSMLICLVSAGQAAARRPIPPPLGHVDSKDFAAGAADGISDIASSSAGMLAIATDTLVDRATVQAIELRNASGGLVRRLADSGTGRGQLGGGDHPAVASD